MVPPTNEAQQSLCAMPDELLEAIFKNFRLPEPEILGRERWEHLELKDNAETGDTRDVYSDENYYIKLETNDEEYSTRLRALSAITQCSKRFHQIAQPLLYKMYPGQRIANIESFIRTLIERPNKRSLVKRMALDPWRASSSLQKSVKDLGLSCDLINNLFHSSKADIQDAQTALLLFLCPEVEVLDLTAGMDWQMSIMGPLLKELLYQRPNTPFRGIEASSPPGDSFSSLPLRKLRKLSARFADTNHIAGTGMLDSFFSLPTIKSLTLYRFTSKADILVRMSQLEELCLWRCTFDWDSVVDALKYLPNLKSLNIIWAGLICSMGNVHPQPDTQISFDELSAVLQKHNTKLEKLRLDTRELLHHTKSKKPRNLDLSDMLSLKELAIESRALFDKNCSLRPPHSGLPVSLKKLVIFISIQARCPGDTMNDGEDYLALRASDPWPWANWAQLDMLMFHLPSALEAIHSDIPTKNNAPIVAISGWVVEPTLHDEEVARASPVVGTLTDPAERTRLYVDFCKGAPSDHTTTVLRKLPNPL